MPVQVLMKAMSSPEFLSFSLLYVIAVYSHLEHKLTVVTVWNVCVIDVYSHLEHKLTVVTMWNVCVIAVYSHLEYKLTVVTVWNVQ